MCDHNTSRKGTDLKDKSAHEKDHKSWNRRGFIQTLGLGTGAGLTIGGFSLNALASNLLPLALGPVNNDRILILIRLKGGNDGLNTIIPMFDYGTYQNARPNIAINQNNVQSLNSEFAVPNTMESIMDLWESDSMKVINTVGYNDQNLSHFSSSDIWSTADSNDFLNSSGWLGRYILNQNPNVIEDPLDYPVAIKIGGPGIKTFYNDDQYDLAINVSSPTELEQIAETGNLYDSNELPDDCYHGEQVGYIRNVYNNIFRYAEVISETYNSTTNNVDYTSSLGNQLSLVARLIKGGLKTKLYMVTLDGFDTHANQGANHPNLMRNLSLAVSQFYKDISFENRQDDVLCMTFSEFGRRVSQNASNGTDHGAAAPVLMFGGGLNGSGILGENPDLDNLDNIGNLRYSVDFRSIYATILESWLCIDPVAVDSILGDVFPRLDNLGLACSPFVSTNAPLVQDLKHSVRMDGFGGVFIDYGLARPDIVNIKIYTILGQEIGTILNEYKMEGDHSIHYPAGRFGLSTLIYKISTNGKEYSGKFII